MSRTEQPGEHDALDGVPSSAETPIVYGQERCWTDLVAAEQGGRLHHAWLLQGPRGIGKATVAFAFARYLLSLNGEGGTSADAVGRQIAQGSHPNLVHVTRPPADRGGGFKTQITVEEIRKLNRFFQATTAGRQWRVAIIDPVDDMNRNAANALLKILEEPPARSLFLIVNHLAGRLLPTIRSRCRTLRFDPLADEELIKVLLALRLNVTETELRAVLPLAGGSARTAATMLTSGGLEFETRLGAVWSAAEPDWAAIHALADAVTQKGRETAFDFLCVSLLRHVAREAQDRLEAGERAVARRLADLWLGESARLREGAAFNLDRKQLLLTFLARVYDARSPAP